MIISHKHQFVFVHNPKVAGTSVRKVLSPFHDDTREFWHQGWLPLEERVVDLAHLTADIWAPIVDKSYTAFGFVRDPYTRFISGVAEVLRRHKDEFSCSPQDFVRNYVTRTNIRWDWRFIHLCPQHYFFYRGNKLVVDKIGKIETLKSDWASINALIGLKLELPHERVSAPNESFYENNPEFINLVNSLYTRDFLLFGYDMKTASKTDLSYSERIQVIHDPSYTVFFGEEDLSKISFSSGEKIALNRRICATDYSKPRTR